MKSEKSKVWHTLYIHKLMVKTILFVLSGVSAEKYEQAKDTVIKEFDKIKMEILILIKLN